MIIMSFKRLDKLDTSIIFQNFKNNTSNSYINKMVFQMQYKLFIYEFKTCKTYKTN